MSNDPTKCFSGSLCCPAECNFDKLYATTCGTLGDNYNVEVPDNGDALLDVGPVTFVYGEAATTGGLRNLDVTLVVTMVSKTINPVNHTIDYELEVDGFYDLQGTPVNLRTDPLEITVQFNCNSYSRKPVTVIDRSFVTAAGIRDPFMDTNGFELWLSNDNNAFPDDFQQYNRLNCKGASVLSTTDWKFLNDDRPTAADIEFKMGYDPNTGQVAGNVTSAGQYVTVEIETKASDDEYFIACQYNSAYMTFDDDAPFAYSDNWNLGPTVLNDGYTVELISSPDRATRFMYVKWKWVDDVCVDPGPIADPDQRLLRLIFFNGRDDRYLDLFKVL